MSNDLIHLLGWIWLNFSSTQGGRCSNDTLPGFNADTRLMSLAYQVMDTYDVIRCMMTCKRQRLCSTVNYNSTTSSCELNSSEKTASLANATVISAVGWNFLDPLKFKVDVGSCEGHPCNTSEECRETPSGFQCQNKNLCYPSDVKYKGSHNWTRSGKVCQRWDVDYPHKRQGIPQKGLKVTDLAALSLHENFCRHGLFEVPWCYTMDPDTRWENCSIPVC